MRGHDCDTENQREPSPGQVSSGKHLPNLGNCDPRQPVSDLNFSPRPGQSAWVSRVMGDFSKGSFHHLWVLLRDRHVNIISRLSCHWDASREQEVSHFNSNTIMASGQITWESNLIHIDPRYNALCRQVSGHQSWETDCCLMMMSMWMVGQIHCAVPNISKFLLKTSPK